MKRLLVLAVLMVIVVIVAVQLDRGKKPIIPLSDAQQKKLTLEITDAILGNKEFDPKDVPASGGRAVVIISVSNGFSQANIYEGRGETWQAAIVDSIKSLSKEDSNGAKWVKVDFVTHVREPVHFNKKFRMTGDPSLTGIALFGIDGPLYLPEVVVSRSLVSNKGKLRTKNLGNFLTRKQMETVKQKSQLTTFKTFSYAWIEGTLYKLFRGNRI